MEEAGSARLETQRLVLRRFSERDLDPFVSYRNDPEVARYQGWESYTEQEALDFIRSLGTLDPGTPGEWFQFAIEHKETAGLIGDCALKVEERDARQAEIGFTLSRENQGRGFALEAVSRLLDHAFARFDLHRVVAITDRENGPSIALLKRLGLRCEGHLVQSVWSDGEWRDEYLYAILRDEWLDKEPRRKPEAGSYRLPRELARHVTAVSFAPDELCGACREAGEGLGGADAREAWFRSAAEMVGMWRGLDLPGDVAPYAIRDARLGYLAGYGGTLVCGELPEGRVEAAAEARWGEGWREKLAAARRRA